MNPPRYSPIAVERHSARERVYRIPHRIDPGLILEGIYISGLSGILLAANLRVAHRPLVIFLLGVAALAGLWRLARALWLSYSTRVLTLAAEEVTLERSLCGWNHVQQLPASEIGRVVIKRSRWSGGKQEILFLEFTAGDSRLRCGHDLTWEEKYWLCEEAKSFLPRFEAEMAGTPACLRVARPVVQKRRARKPLDSARDRPAPVGDDWALVSARQVRGWCGFV